jgi:hypothetical protein
MKNIFIIFVYILALVCGGAYEISRDKNSQ